MTANQLSFVCVVTAKEQAKVRVLKEFKHIAMMTRQEPGNINYCLHVSVEKDNVFMIYENWKDQSALNAHMTKPYIIPDFPSKQ